MAFNSTSTVSSGFSSRPRVVVVGGGFAGLEVVRGLSRVPVDVLLIDKSNHHLFQPLLYQVATAVLTPAEIASPIRQLVKEDRRVQVMLGEVTGVDPAGRTLTVVTDTVTQATQRVAFDYLVLAVGMQNFYFGHADWRAEAPGLKTLKDATHLRAKILRAFETAESESDPDRQRELLTFVVVGGGPTGCEMAGAIAEMARTTLPREFRRIDSRTTRIFLVEAAPRLLLAFSEGLSARARTALEKMGVDVLLGQPVQHIDSHGIVVGDVRFPSSTVIWAAGVKAVPAGDWLGVPVDRQGRVVVNPDCRVPGFSYIFAAGDVMHLELKGRPLPGVAQVALQQGRYIGRALGAQVMGKPPLPPFHYQDRGNMAAIGRNFAVMESGPFQLSGRLAFWAWAIIHIFFLVNLHNRILVFLRWTWAYFTNQRMARLIVDPQEH